MPTDCLLTVSCLPASFTLLQSPAGLLCSSRVHALPALASAILLCTDSSSSRCFQRWPCSASTSPLWRGRPLLCCCPVSLCALITIWNTLRPACGWQWPRVAPAARAPRRDRLTHSGAPRCAGWTARDARGSGPWQGAEDRDADLNRDNPGCSPRGCYLSQPPRKGKWTKGLRVQDSRQGEGRGREAWTQVQSVLPRSRVDPGPSSLWAWQHQVVLPGPCLAALWRKDRRGLKSKNMV